MNLYEIEQKEALTSDNDKLRHIREDIKMTSVKRLESLKERYIAKYEDGHLVCLQSEYNLINDIFEFLKQNA